MTAPIAPNVESRCRKLADEALYMTSLGNRFGAAPWTYDLIPANFKRFAIKAYTSKVISYILVGLYHFPIVRYKVLGNSGLRVSELAPGTMTLGDKPTY